MHRKTIKKILKLIPLLILAAIVFWLKSPARMHRNDMKLLYSDINGEVKALFINRGMSLIRLENRFDFISIGNIIDEIGEKKAFHNFLDKNDFIYSPIGSDSVYVIKGNSKQGFKMDIRYSK